MNQTNSSSYPKPTSFGNTTYGFAWQNYIYMVVTSFGMLTNIINVSVFIQIKQKDVRLKYMLWKSLGSFFYLAFSFMSEFFSGCTNCPSTKLYFAVFHSIYFVIYLSSCLALFRILIELVLSLSTFSILIGRNWFAKIAPQIILVIIGIVSLAFYSPRFAAYTILMEPLTNEYYIGVTRFGQSNAFKVISISQSLVRTFFNVIVLGLVNIFTLIQVKKWFRVRPVEFFINQVNILQIGINRKKFSIFT